MRACSLWVQQAGRGGRPRGADGQAEPGPARAAAPRRGRGRPLPQVHATPRSSEAGLSRRALRGVPQARAGTSRSRARPSGPGGAVWRASGTSPASWTPFTRSRSSPAEGCRGSRRPRPRWPTSASWPSSEHYRYHGRVLRQDGWVVLQYWLFYPFNDWRSGFFGANDHEADWEKIFVYLSESDDGRGQPRVGRLRGPQLHGGQPQAPLGRPRGREGGGAPRDLRRRGLPRQLLRPGRVPDRADLPLPGP